MKAGVIPYYILLLYYIYYILYISILLLLLLYKGIIVYYRVKIFLESVVKCFKCCKISGNIKKTIYIKSIMYVIKNNILLQPGLFYNRFWSIYV